MPRNLYLEHVQAPSPELESGWFVKEWPSQKMYRGFEVAFIGINRTVIPAELPELVRKELEEKSITIDLSKVGQKYQVYVQGLFGLLGKDELG